MPSGGGRKSIWLGVAAGLLLVAVAWIWVRRFGATPRDLPLDLSHQRFVVLALPPGTERLSWLPRRLKVLDLSHSKAVSDLSGLPPDLEEVNASYTPVRELATLPRHLKALDVESTYLKTLGHLPRSLVRLSIGSTQLAAIDALPPRLEELSIHGAALHELPVLPASLRVLHLEGPNFEGLEGLPEALRWLTLTGTRIASLKGLPPELERLDLSSNEILQQLGIDYLPTYLQQLTTDQATLPNDLAKFKLLSVLDARRATPDAHWPLPPSLTTLRLADLPPNIREFPPDLRLLGLIGDKSRSLEELNLPTTLRALELDLCQNERLDFAGHSSLQQLSLAFSRVSHIDNLPTDLLSLDLSGTPMKELPENLAQQLPNLRVLRLRSMQYLERVPALPAELRVLDLEGSCRISALPSPLPDRLRSLLIGGTRIAVLPNLPSHLRVLDIFDTAIHSLNSVRGGLPVSLEELSVAPRQLSFIGAPRPNLTTIRFARRES
jgi:Leucine-rich repeat (LRR) protein